MQQVKGAVLKARLGFVAEHGGPAGLRRVLDALPEADRGARDMDIRLARFVAIAVVVVVLGGLLLSGWAKRLERQLASRPQVIDTISAGPPDSARAVALAEYAYRADHAVRGEAAPRPGRLVQRRLRGVRAGARAARFGTRHARPGVGLAQRSSRAAAHHALEPG